MKIRKGFVTNSSSSSYICEICGDVQGGYDLSRDDAGILRCENDHEFCYCHVMNHFDEFSSFEDMVDSNGFDFLDYINPNILLDIAKREDITKTADILGCSSDLEECVELLTLATTKGNKKGKKEAKELLNDRFHDMRNRIMLIWSMVDICHNYNHGGYYKNRIDEVKILFLQNTEDSHEDIITYIKDWGYSWGDKLPQELCPICQMKEVSERKRKMYLLAKLHQKEKEIDTEILTMNRQDFLKSLVI